MLETVLRTWKGVAQASLTRTGGRAENKAQNITQLGGSKVLSFQKTEAGLEAIE